MRVVKRVPGEGVLPRVAGEAEPAAGAKVVEAVVGGGETVLVVEDEPALLRVSRPMLELQGHRVLAASTPAEAIRPAGEHEGAVDFLVIDVVMPDMNGRELSERLLSRCPGLKVLFLSGYTANVIARHGVLEEGVHFIQKPFSLLALSAKTREVLDA